MFTAVAAALLTGLAAVIAASLFIWNLLLTRAQGVAKAAELIALGGGFAPESPEALHHRLATLLSGSAARSAAGEAAAAYVRANLGAAERGATVIEELL
jgi:hypothetical protein